MANILIVTATKSFYINAIKKRLEELSYNVSVIPASTDAIHNFKEPVNGVLIYSDDKLTEQHQPLNYLKDKAIADNVPIFIIGDREELRIIANIIPKQIISREFARPIDVPELCSQVDEMIKNHNVMKRVLVVDDSGAMLRNVKGWLEGKYVVTLANSGAMAIKYLALNRPDLVLLDYEMPVVDGKQVLEMIRSEAEFADIPVIFLTGKSNKEYILNIQSLKPEGYLLKTLEPNQIVKAVDDFFEKQKGMRYNAGN